MVVVLFNEIMEQVKYFLGTQRADWSDQPADVLQIVLASRLRMHSVACTF